MSIEFTKELIWVKSKIVCVVSIFESTINIIC
jgi:hypothetical protein